MSELSMRVRQLEILANSTLANNLCPDHRDKQAGKPCLACEIERLGAQRDQLREACEAACRAAADCLPPSGEGELDAMYYKAKLQAIDEAAAKCSTALKECGE